MRAFFVTGSPVGLPPLVPGTAASAIRNSRRERASLHKDAADAFTKKPKTSQLNMPKKPNPVRVVTDPVLPMDEIKKLSLKEACARFAERAAVSQRAFAEMGKLHNAISESLKKGQTIYGELRKVGVKDSTISNASYASKIVDLVKAGHITEAQYDGFTFADCLAVCRVMGQEEPPSAWRGRSRRRHRREARNLRRRVHVDL